MGEDDRKVLEKEGIRVLCAKCGGGNGVLL
jgi:hypothetical protein